MTIHGLKKIVKKGNGSTNHTPTIYDTKMDAFIHENVKKQGFSIYERTRDGHTERLAASFPKKKQAIAKAKDWFKWLACMQEETGLIWEHIVKDDRNGKVLKVFS